jgi:hypothetical protein
MNISELDSGFFDHAVINLRYSVDEGEAFFRNLGFHLSSRGCHTLGSVNHLIVFEDDYLELVGLDAANPKPRAELLESPVGLNGLVFKSVDCERTHSRVVAQGLAASPPQRFSHDVLIAGEQRTASFCAVRFPLDVIDAGRVYFCQHHTPELVWHPDFKVHPNTAFGMDRAVVVSTQPSDDARWLAAAVQGELVERSTVAVGQMKIVFCEFACLERDYGEFLQIPADGRRSWFAGLRIRVRSIARLNAALADLLGPESLLFASGRTVVASARCSGTVLEFVQHR